MMREEASDRGDLIGPLDWLKIVPFAPAAASDRLGWVGLEATRYRTASAAEYHPPALTHHWLVPFMRPPGGPGPGDDGGTRPGPPPPGPVSPGAARAPPPRARPRRPG